jgi:Glycosyl hydrolase family 79 C-terminal beta domain
MASMRAMRRLPALLAVLAAIGVLVLALAAWPAAHIHTTVLRQRAPAGTPVLRVGAPLPVAPIAPGFVGLSLEYTALPAYAGNDPSALDPVFLQLVRNLDPNQSPVLRLGGDTTDWSWVAVPGMRQPRGIRYTIGAGLLQVAGAVTRALHPRWILGINLEADSKPLASTEARALVSAVGRTSVEALELGNEPELYGSWGWYTAPDGKPVPGRRPGYDLASYASDFRSFASALPRVPLAGPATANVRWMNDMRAFIRTVPRLRLVTVHRYPLRACDVPAASSAAPTIANLLSSAASVGLADSAAAAVRGARSRGLPLRVDELNSVSCKGKRGVSNAFASALWALDTLFAMARAGVAGVNIHTLPGSSYQPFVIEHRGGRWSALVEPEYYGMLMFAEAAPPGSRLLATAGGSRAGVASWATRLGRRVRVVLINDASRRARAVSVRVPGAAGKAALSRLHARSARATGGVTLGGQSFGPRTATGLLSGEAERTLVAPTRGSYTVELPPASAAMLTVERRREAG